MAIDLSNIIFTDQDDIVPLFGVEEIVNNGIANTLAGNDVITGTGGDYGFENGVTLNTDDGNDTITGTGTLTGIIIGSRNGLGMPNSQSVLDTGKGNDVITGTGGTQGIITLGTLNTNDDNDIVTGSGTLYGIITGSGSTLDTGKGNDIITGISAFGIANYGTINTGDAEDSLISQGMLINIGGVFLGNGNDSLTINIIPSSTSSFLGVQNSGVIETGDGNDLITSTESIYNLGSINTGNGDDSIIVGGGVNGTLSGHGIFNNGGSINTGNGNDSIIANEGFELGYYGSSVVLGNGKDYLKGFGSGEFSGGNGNDTLELTSGTYTIGRWYTAVTFSKGDQLMITSEFEKLIAGSTTYDFTSLTKGQTITVA